MAHPLCCAGQWGHRGNRSYKSGVVGAVFLALRTAGRSGAGVIGPGALTGASRPAGLQVEFINPIFEFSRAMQRLGLDDAEYALLIAINIFSADRPNVQETSRVEALQQPYVEALLSYTRIKRPQVRPPGAPPLLAERVPPKPRGGTGGRGPHGVSPALGSCFLV